ncbi:MAG: hypothetical protein Q7J68_06835 [Thermoplasmata archaeon]|nr:hypothetical protein [Thermoplasmata archaeon]
MREMWVRGIFFTQVLEYVKSDLGRTSYELLGKKEENYTPEEKYPFEDFADLLEKIKLIAYGKDDYIAKIARDCMTKEASWKAMFRRMDPANVFSSTQRQEGRQQVADYEALDIAKGHVVIQMAMWTDNRSHQDVWSEFYRGRLVGILELMGRKGTVKLTREFGNDSFTYTIEWS